MERNEDQSRRWLATSQLAGSQDFHDLKCGCGTV